MRHKGSVSQVNIERDKVALRLFHQAKRLAQWPTNTVRLCEIAATLPVKEFFISDETAVRYISKRLRNHHNVKFKNKYKHLLYNALYDRVMSLRQADQQHSSLSALVLSALATEAPCIGLTPRGIYMILLSKKSPKLSSIPPTGSRKKNHR